MPIQIDQRLTPQQLVPQIELLFELSAHKILSLEKSWPPANGTPVFTVQGRYTSRGWTEWTQGFQFGSALLQFDAAGDQQFLKLGRQRTIDRMASHVSHLGVHDHGFNNLSTYGHLWRLMREGKIPFAESEHHFYELALKISGAVQAARWSRTADGGGFIYSFNGPHSLFVDTVRSCRSLAVAHQLGHVLMGEQDRPISLLRRLLDHMASTARYSVFYGTGRDAYDVRGRTAHECLFNPNNGEFRCPGTQQGYSPFSTWTRGLAWALCGFAEQLEFLRTLSRAEWEAALGTGGGSPGARAGTARARSAARVRPRPPASRRASATPETVERTWREAAMATADFYLEHACADGIPMWDTGAPNLGRLGDYLDRPADPFNRWEPVDSSAAAIAAQGLVRLGRYLANGGDRANSRRYQQAGLTIARTLFAEPYLSTAPSHQGLLLHSVYHRPNGWDHVAPGQHVPNGESSMWGDYHARELALLLWRTARGESYLTFFRDPAARRHSTP